MFGYRCGKDVKLVNAYSNEVMFESVMSNRIRAEARRNCRDIGKVKPYAGIRYEYELSGKVKGAIQNGADIVGDIPAPSFVGGSGIG